MANENTLDRPHASGLKTVNRSKLKKEKVTHGTKKPPVSFASKAKGALTKENVRSNKPVINKPVLKGKVSPSTGVRRLF